MKNSKSQEISLKILEKGAKENAGLVAYVVDNNGKLVETAAFNKDSAATLKVSRTAVDGQHRIYIAQAVPKHLEKKVNELTLIKAGAYQVVKNFTGNVLNITRLPSVIYDPWIFDNCLIQGNVTNTVTINGQEVTSPVCNARVHLVEVETTLLFPHIPILYKRIPDWVISEISQKLLEIQVPPIPDPIGPVANSFKEIRSNSFVNDSINIESLPTLPQHIIEGISSTSISTIRQTLADNHEFLHPYFCLWPWCWPWFYYEADEDNIVYTDCDGHFEFWENLFTEDGPLNIYAWVEVNINGVWTTVYRPWLPCNTIWNYPCNSDINISLNDINIPPCACDPLPGAFVHLQSVSGGVSIRNIQQSESASGHLSNAVGLTGYGGFGNISPFTAGFTFRLFFGADLNGAVYNGKTITHYRWSYTRQRDAYLTAVGDSTHYLNPAIGKPNWYYTFIPGTGFERIDNAFTLGPIMVDTANNPIPAMYKIPHAQPYMDDPTLPVDAQSDAYTDSIYVDTSKYPEGLYQFTFELLDDNGNVVPVPAADCPFLVDTNAYPVTAINADGLPENYVTHDGGGNVVAFNFKMRIDNSYCYAGISDALVDGHTTDTECGTGTYDDKVNDTVDIIFQAGHPHNFATLDFNIYKGNSGALAIAATGGTSANQNAPSAPPIPLVTSGANGYDITQVNSAFPTPKNNVTEMDQYHKSFKVIDMLGDCTTAAFSENLNVYATHTNGVSRIGYDASDIAAIAISPAS